MMRAGLIVAALLSTGTAAAQGFDLASGVYANDPGHSYVTFSYGHQGLSYPRLRAVDVSAELALDADDLEASSVAAVVAADSIRSNVDFFDDELASAKFFNVGRYPDIAFVSERIEMTGEDEGLLHGQVSIRQTTRPLTLAFKINGARDHPFTGTPVLGFSASGELRRSEFGLDRFIPAVTDRVTLAIEMEFALGATDASRAAAARAREVVGSGDDE